MLLPTLAYLIATRVRNTVFLINIWFFSIIISFFLGDSMEMFINNFFKSIGFADNRADNMFANELDGQTVARSFRIDFILYSSVGIIIGYYTVIKKKFQESFYLNILNTYIIANTVWILLIYANYTNRTAYLSWFIMPIVLIYPFLKSELVKGQSIKIGWLILGSLVFTLIMFFK